MLKSLFLAFAFSLVASGVSSQSMTNRSMHHYHDASYPEARTGMRQPAICDTSCLKTHHHNFDREQIRQFREQAQLKRRQYYVSQMGLSDSEKEVFLNLFDKYIRDIHHSRAVERKARYELTDATDDAGREKLINIIILEGDKQNNIRKEFLNQLKNTFSFARVSLFLMAEGEFNRQLVRSFDDNRK